MANAGTSLAVQHHTVMALPLLHTPVPPPRVPAIKPDDYLGIEDLDRPELDEAPDTDPCPTTLPSLEWDDGDGESGVKQRRSV